MYRIAHTLVISIFLFSCNNNAENELSAYRTLNEGMEKANQVIKQSTKEKYQEFYDKLYDVRFNVYAKKYEPKVKSIQALSDSILIYMKNLKEALEVTYAKENDIFIVQKKFAQEGKANELLNKILIYGKNMFNLGEEFKKVFAKNPSNILIGLDSVYESFYKKYFNAKPLIAAKTVLTKFENDVIRMENDFVDFSKNRMPYIDNFFTVFRTIIGQSSNYVKGGDKLTITAGVGEFSTVSAPKFIINNTKVNTNESAVAIYEFKTNINPGKYTIPVVIEYTKADGQLDTIKSLIEYTVKE